MLNEKTKAENTTNPEPKEAVKLSGGLGAFYKFTISTRTSVFEILAENYEQAINKIKGEIKIPSEFVNDCYLEKVTIVDTSTSLQEVVK